LSIFVLFYFSVLFICRNRRSYYEIEVIEVMRRRKVRKLKLPSHVDLYSSI
jgi:hypothetical protein